MTRSQDNSTAHSERTGLTANGSLVDLPQYQHTVSQDVNRLEFSLQRAFRSGWALRMSAPYIIKEQSGGIADVNSFTAEQLIAAQRAQISHHQTDDEDGFGDGNISLYRMWRGALTSSDQLILSLGTTLPFGHVEGQPLPGHTGGQHLRHFGNGSFDPVANLSWYQPIGVNQELSFGLFHRKPTSTGDEGYRGSSESNWRLGYSKTWTRFRASTSFNYNRRGFSSWSDMRDEGSGVESYDAGLSIAWTQTQRRTVSLNVSIPLDQHNLSPLGDTFDKGPSVFIGYAMPFSF